MSETTVTRCDVIGCDNTREDGVRFTRIGSYEWAHIEIEGAHAEYDLCPNCVQKYLVPILERK